MGTKLKFVKKIMRTKTFWFFFYACVSFIIFYFLSNPQTWLSSHRPYYVDIAHSLLQGKFNIHLQITFDLSEYNGNLYLYFGILPAILFITFYLLGLRTDIIFSILILSVMTGIFYILLKTFSEKRKLGIRTIFIHLLTLGFAFGTVNFSLGMIGQMYHLAQIVGELFLIISILALITSKNKYGIILSGFLISLSFLSRNTYFLSLPFFILYIWAFFPKKRIISILLFLLPFVFAFSFQLFYNYERFGSPLETGLKYQMGADQYKEAQKDLLSQFNIKYLPLNFETMFLKYITWDQFQKGQFDGNGYSIFMTSPFLFLIFPAYYFMIKKERKLLSFALLSPVILAIATLLLYFGTGFYQFGYRYQTDFLPFVFLGLLYFFNKFKNLTWPILLLFILSFIINIRGYYWRRM